MPLFLVAWPVALLTGAFPLTLATFIGVYVTFRVGAGLGPADGKIAVGLAGILPVALAIAVALHALMFLIMRLRGERDNRLPGAVGFYASTVAAILWLVVQLLSAVVL